MEARWGVSARHRRRQWERICSILLSERKGKKGRCQKVRNDPEPYLLRREVAQDGWPHHWLFAFGCDYTICDYIYVVICDTYIFCNEFTSFFFCLSVLPGCRKYSLKIYNLDQRISTEDQQQCNKKDNLMHWYVPDKNLSPMGQNGDQKWPRNR